jgi:hypothetical protein
VTRTVIPRPGDGEHAPFYAGYVALTAESGDVVALLAAQPAELRVLCDGLSEAEARHRYAPGKWSVKEVVCHLADAERIFAYRALRVARGDGTPLPGFDENAYVEASGADDRPLPGLLAELDAVRAATLALFRSLPPEALERRGTANGAPISVRALAYITAGHTAHHLRILRERYGLGVQDEPAVTA